MHASKWLTILQSGHMFWNSAEIIILNGLTMASLEYTVTSESSQPTKNISSVYFLKLPLSQNIFFWCSLWGAQLFRQSFHPTFPSFDLGCFQIDEGQDHIASLESLAHFSEVDLTYFFMLDDEKTNRYNIDWLIKSSTESINNAYYVSNIKLLLLF